MLDLREVIKTAISKRASDVFVIADSPICWRVAGKIVPSDLPPLTPDECRELAHSLMTPAQIERFEHRHELDLGFEIPEACRVRANIYQQRGSFGVACRLIPLKVIPLEKLGMPDAVREMCKYSQGLVIVTGPTGSGKTTTLASMLDLINTSRAVHIVTVEDPIEFSIKHKKGIVSQREVGLDTETFADALRYMLRQNPDVIMIGEMRDLETFNVALAAAETGHLVFSTLHTPSAAETLDRIINMYPPSDRDKIFLRLSSSLKGVISQKLVPTVDGTARISAVEVMISTPTIAKLIEEGKPGQIYGAIAEGSFYGMQTMNQSLLKTHRSGMITEEEALNYAGNATELKQMMRRPPAPPERR